MTVSDENQGHVPVAVPADSAGRLDAAALAELLGMLPFAARHLGLDTLYRRTDKRSGTESISRLRRRCAREIGMTYWLGKAEAKIRDLA